ncbi:transcription-repair coupling factor [Clostridium formicaceticum]|uniref:Transcription-repair-coupling factor n=1 Tax=Clostridium formicaceticum TaxID=1497 RepID=A0AAC9WEI7_9CLOT|nr:transcription-repair coupling factor [Clostridium formicaceticum]AOY75506.1 transcription-repair coupling factor [Clostridium formicaceticum]ARE85797.1 Transcription-repair-coupling factor [Clostridium formicaceticum]
MKKNVVLSPLENSLQYLQLAQTLREEKSSVSLHGLDDSQRGHVAYGLYKGLRRQLCLLTYSEIEAQQIYQDLKFYVEDQAIFFPTKDIVFYDVEATSEEVSEERIKALNKLVGGEACIVVASIDALLLKLTPVDIYKKYQLAFTVGQRIHLQQVTENFILQDYERVERVDTKGQFSIRGGIIDIFPPAEENPIRIELFDDEVDSIRYFEVETQKSIEKIEKITVYPAKEIIIEVNHHEKTVPQLSQELKNTLKKLDPAAGEKLQGKIAEAVERLSNLGRFKGIQKFLPYIYEKAASLIDYFQEEAIVIVDEPDRGKEKIKGYLEEFRENFKTLLERGEVLPNQAHLLFNYEEIIKRLKDRSLVTSSLLPKNHPDLQPKKIINFISRPVQSFYGKMNHFVKEISSLQQKGYEIRIVTTTKEKAMKLLELLREEEVLTEFFVKDDAKASHKGKVVILQGNLHRGFEYVDIKYILFTDYEIYGAYKKKKQKIKRKDTSPIKSFIDLQVGDYVVHEGHGIGKYIGIEELKVEGVKKDYLKIRYSGEDNLYLPTDQMDLIQKYIGADDKAPKLNKLGGTEWVKTKAKAKKAIEDMAKDLLKLYAEREKSKGYAFSRDTDWQKQFEYLFPYEETPDQIRCIEEMKKDMEVDRSMDRLLCGDVGYGKTEVAIRGAFKCVMDSKQVAVLVPTTILAQQHYNNFKERFSGFPVTVEMLSRFRTPTQQKHTIESVRTGNIDVLIGTHRLLSKDVVFKDLGLLIVDEEQRFGVKHKEALKQLKKSVDVLTLTATPIPRTLHMSMIGVRDMSVIEDPPEERYPVQTYVASYNESLITDALTREMARGGQVYYVYNRVQGIHQVAAKLGSLVPQARVGVAHGQMSERQLEKLMLEYYHGEYDVLVCTTIIETGLDIANVNTIIIQDADRLGLSQLYQLRGRVGRSNRQGYAYLLYEKDKILSEVAEKRLKAIKEFTEFGSGFKIAMRDLEIRGAGNLLGSEQHGHMASIGYDLYVKLLEETVGELKGEKIEKYEDTMMELNVDAYISEKYISNPSHKIEIYKKIASIRNEEDMYAIEEEIEDRFGDIPLSVRNLLLISYIKALAKNLKIQYISQKEKSIRIQFREAKVLRPENIVEVMESYRWKVTIHGGQQPYITYKIQTQDQYKVLLDIKGLIEKISGLKKAAS